MSTITPTEQGSMLPLSNGAEPFDDRCAYCGGPRDGVGPICWGCFGANAPPVRQTADAVPTLFDHVVQVWDEDGDLARRAARRRRSP